MLEKHLVLLKFYENKFSLLCWVHVIFIIIAFDKPSNTKKLYYLQRNISNLSHSLKLIELHQFISLFRKRLFESVK